MPICVVVRWGSSTVIEVRQRQGVGEEVDAEVGHDGDPARWPPPPRLAMVGDVAPPVPDDAERERALARQWRLAQVNLLLALLLLGIAGLWWFSADATWQAPTFTVLGILITVAAISNVRQQQRNRRRRQERENPR